MKKSITPSYSKDFSHSEIHKFNFFYKNSVVNFLINNNLCLVGEQDGFVVKETLDSNKYYGTVLKTKEQIENRLNSILNFHKNAYIYWSDYTSKFFKDIYFSANDTNKEILINSKIYLIDSINISIAFKDNSNELLKFITESKSIHNEIMSYSFHSLIENWKKTLTDEQFNYVIIDYLTFYKKEFKKIKNKINLEYIIKNYIDDENTINTLKNLIPSSLIDENDIFNKNINVYEIQVTKQKLYEYIKLKDLNVYNNMYNILIEVLNESHNLKTFNIIKVEKEEKFKSSKTFNFLVKTNLESNCKKENFEKILLALFKGFEFFSKTESNEYTIKKLMTQEWIQSAVLDKILIKKDSNKKLHKI